MLLTKQIGPWYTIRPIRRFCKQCLHNLRGEYINSSHVQAVINRTKNVDKYEFSDWRHRVEFKSHREFESERYIWKGDIVGYLGLDLGESVFAQATENDPPLYSILELC